MNQALAVTKEKPGPKAKPPAPTSPSYKDWCVGDERLSVLRKELDRHIASVKPKAKDASYRIDLEDNCVYFRGGAEKETCTTLIQPDSAIMNALRRGHFIARIHKESIEEKLERLLGGDEKKLDRLIAALDKNEG